MSDLALYLGTWELIPELSLYQTGSPPAEAVYSIRLTTPREVDLQVRWRSAEGAGWQEVRFGGPVDGTRQQLAGAPGAARKTVSFTITHVDDRTLDSTSSIDDRQVAFARRVASADGRLLAVVRESQTAQGGTARNFQVYRRVEA